MDQSAALVSEAELDAVRSTVERGVLVSAYVALARADAPSNVTRVVRWPGPYAGYEVPTVRELATAHAILLDLAAGAPVEWATRRTPVS